MTYNALTDGVRITSEAVYPNDSLVTNGLNMLVSELVAGGFVTLVQSATTPPAPTTTTIWYKPDTGLSAGAPPVGNAAVLIWDGGIWQTMTPARFAEYLFSFVTVAPGAGISQADADLRYVNLTGDTMTGSLNIGPIGSPHLMLSANAGTPGRLIGSRAGSQRWELGFPDATAESGGNAGSNFVINRFDDAGANLGTALSINRATGVTTLNSGTAWSSGNDGTGSGLDADTVDGLHASSFLTSATLIAAIDAALGSATWQGGGAAALATTVATGVYTMTRGVGLVTLNAAGCTIAYVSSDIARVTFTAAQANKNYLVQVVRTEISGSGDGQFPAAYHILTATTSSFEIHPQDTPASPFNYMFYVFKI